MNIEELEKLEKMEKERHKREMDRLAISFAKSNQKFEIGQIIENHNERIKIDKIKYGGWSFGAPPCCIYYGTAYTLKNTPYKNNRKAGIRGDSGIITLIREKEDL